MQLKRFYSSNKYTLGILTVKNKFFFTLELPWLENKRNISCIPVGAYSINKHISPKFGECFSIKNVENRSDILIHSGNNAGDTQGCILIGNDVNNKGIVFTSKIALEELLEVAEDGETIEIIKENE